MANHISIATVTVTMNGMGVLVQHLTALLGQTRPIQETIVVDNASTDGTVGLLKSDFPDITVLQLAENLGVGGGFAAGLEYALRRGHDCVWLFDQDSVPAPTALAELLEVLASLQGSGTRIGVLASIPVHAETGFEYSGFLWRDRLVCVPSELARQDVCFVDSVVSSGSLIRREAVEDAGLPRPDFFMDYVDHEYNLRIRRRGYAIAVVRRSVLYHRIGQPRLISRLKFGRTVLGGQQVAWRSYYMSRNQTYTAWKLFPTSRSRIWLLIHLLKRAGGIILHEKEKLGKLRLHFIGVSDGLREKLGRREGLPPS
jgi:rhamnopyranosyl-N-acetylglucosaminyl-diphospho-decaprenol beta-1,3/1,4-galactofuranosyltransferase